MLFCISVEAFVDSFSVMSIESMKGPLHILVLGLLYGSWVSFIFQVNHFNQVTPPDKDSTLSIWHCSFGKPISRSLQIRSSNTHKNKIISITIFVNLRLSPVSN